MAKPILPRRNDKPTPLHPANLAAIALLAHWGEDNPSEPLIAGLESLLVYVHQQYGGDIGQWLQTLRQETD